MAIVDHENEAPKSIADWKAWASAQSTEKLMESRDNLAQIPDVMLGCFGIFGRNVALSILDLEIKTRVARAPPKPEPVFLPKESASTSHWYGRI